MANCTDCEKYTFCPLVENGDVDVYAEAKEKNCENFERESNMADNDRFKIEKVKQPIECKGCEYDFETCEVTCEHNIRKGKTISEYEDMILQTINKELDKVLKNGEKINNIGLAKAVVDRLFGEGE